LTQLKSLIKPSLHSPRFKISPSIDSSFWRNLRVDLGFSIIGAPKCGTTWLDIYLNHHPSIFLPGEQNVFTLFQEKGADYFNSLYEGHDAQLLGDHSNINMLDPNLPEIFAKKYPQMKLIMVCREPVSRAFSHYLMDTSKGHINPEVNSFYDVLFEPITYSYYDLGLYAKHLKRYLEFFDKNSILVLTLDEIANFPDVTMKKVFEFLSVQPSINLPPIQRENTWEQRKIERHSSVFFIRRLAMIFFPKKIYSPLRDHWFKNHHQHFLKVVAKYYHPQKPEGDSIERGKDLLRDLYLESNAELESLTGLNLSSWNQIKG